MHASTDEYEVPTLEAMGYEPLSEPLKYPGGESVALSKLDMHIARTQWIAAFEKPKTSPNR
jgi:cryptochrome